MKYAPEFEDVRSTEFGIVEQATAGWIVEV
jgi:hypothetical protein